MVYRSIRRTPPLPQDSSKDGASASPARDPLATLKKSLRFIYSKIKTIPHICARGVNLKSLLVKIQCFLSKIHIAITRYSAVVRNIVFLCSKASGIFIIFQMKTVVSNPFWSLPPRRSRQRPDRNHASVIPMAAEDISDQVCKVSHGGGGPCTQIVI